MGADAHFAALVLLAGAPVLAGIWVLLSPDRILSQEMTWDLLFILEGAWHLYHGHIAHVDFHDSVGELNFRLAQAGIYLVGPSPLAFLVGVVIAATATFVLASWAAWRRLPLLPAVALVVFVCLLVLTPTNVGDRLTDFSFAMSYNRYGWSAISILLLILFLPPRNGRHGDWGDFAAAAVLLVAMFYLKITYFLVGLAALGCAVPIFPHIRRRWKVWVVIGCLLVANAVAPHNRPYLADISDAISTGALRDDFALHAKRFLSYANENAPYAAAFVLAWLMLLRRRVSLQLPIAITFILVAGPLLLSQNAQSHGMPVCILIAFLFYDHLRQRLWKEPFGTVRPFMMALLIFPLFAISEPSASLIGYRFKATSDDRLHIVDRTPLRGLAVPVEADGMLHSFSGGVANYQLFSRVRSTWVRYEISPFEYVETILEAATLWQKGRLHGGVALLDQVNPLPFVLGLPPPRGGNLWSGANRTMRKPESFFADVDYVFIPKFSTDSAYTSVTMTNYGSFLAEHFPYREESQSWIVLSREAR